MDSIFFFFFQVAVQGLHLIIILLVTYFLTSQMNNNPIKLTQKDVLSSCVYLQSSPGCHLKFFFSCERTTQLIKPVLRCLYNLSYLHSALVINQFTITWFSGFIILQLSLKNKNKIPQLCKKQSLYLAKKFTCHLKNNPFYSQSKSFSSLRRASLLHEESPDLGFLVQTNAIKPKLHTKEPTEPNHWFSSAV